MLERDYSKEDAKDDDGDFEMHRPGSAGKAKKRPQPDGGASPRTPSGGKRRSGNMGPPAAISDMDSLAGGSSLFLDPRLFLADIDSQFVLSG